MSTYVTILFECVLSLSLALSVSTYAVNKYTNMCVYVCVCVSGFVWKSENIEFS